MAHYHWRDLFLPHIWQRGHNYYRDGRVLRIQHCGNYITAEIEGTDMYHVSVALDTATNRIEDFSCDCPYGEDGTPYLFSFRQDDLKHVEKIKAILSPIEWENMRSKLLDSKTMQYQIYPLLQAEGLFEQMVMRIEANIDIHNLV